MTDDKLELLRSLPVPPPRPQAKAVALAAARAAFAAAATDTGAASPASARSTPDDKIATATQAFADADRPTGANPEPARSIRMRQNSLRQHHYTAIAASIAALAVAAPSVFYLMHKAPIGVDRTRMALNVPPAGNVAPHASATGPQPVSSQPIGPRDESYVRVPEPTERLREFRGEVSRRGAASAPPMSRDAEKTVQLYSGGAAPASPVPALKKSDEMPGTEGPRLDVAKRIIDAPAQPKDAGNLKIEKQVEASEASGKAADKLAKSRAEAESDRRLAQVEPVTGQASPAKPSIAAAPPAASHLRGLGSNQLALGGADLPVQSYNLGVIDRLAAVALPPPSDQPQVQPQEHRDQFDAPAPNPVKSVAAEPVSTFSIDVDTASYSLVRRSLNAGRLPPKAAVRVEEMINYFPYEYPRPDGAEMPFQSTVQVFPAPWNAAHQLVHIAVQGYDLKAAERPRANLVFLVDISGSMQPADRLPLLKNAFRMLLDTLKPDDTVAIVTYASGSDVRLPATRVADKSRIAAAIDSLNAGGSTAGAQGISDAYKVAEAGFDKAAVNRVILATDGDWNVGITNREELKGFIERKRETGIYLSILGVGMGNHNDALMQTLAQNGNGTAAYIDTLSEARKVLVDEASSTLFPIAKDVKIQLEFNPARVSEYRLIGYETRMLRREDFNNDKVDAGDVGSGHAVTAIYEITPVGSPKLADDLRYQKAAVPTATAAKPDALDAEIGQLKFRYKLPKEEASRLATFIVGPSNVKSGIAEASTEARFSTAVAAFGQLLGGQPYLQSFGFDDVIALANGARSDDAFGYRAEFVNLVRLAKTASPNVDGGASTGQRVRFGAPTRQ